MKRVVLVDDDALMREVLRRGLERDGFLVSVWGSAQDALADISNRPPGLVVSDVRMPGMDGIEFLRALRSRHLDIPVVLITADLAPDITQCAVELGARVIKKPLSGMGRLVSEVAAAYRSPDALDEALRMDTLRLDLITDLSHQLRTPLTAMRLALDGLFSQLEGSMNPPQRRLADISRRNVDRVMELVNNQMTLLQMVLGEIDLSRCLVDIRSLIERITSELFDDNAKLLTVDYPDDVFFLFTDSARLSALVRTLLCGGPPSAPRRISLRRIDEFVEILVSIQLLSGNGGMEPDSDPADPGALQLVAAPSKIDFERRAYGAIVDDLGGVVVLEKDNNHKHARITLPVTPAFDRGYDFVNPVQTARRAAERDHSSITLIKMLFDDTSDAVAGGSTALPDFLSACCSVISPDDRILRGRESGAYYVVLIGRSRDDVVQCHSALEARAAGLQWYVHRPQTLLEDTAEVDRIVDSIEELI